MRAGSGVVVGSDVNVDVANGVAVDSAVWGAVPAGFGVGLGSGGVHGAIGDLLLGWSPVRLSSLGQWSARFELLGGPKACNPAPIG